MASAFINPQKILNENLDLKNNTLAADFGCGSGEWTVALAGIIHNGKVYAIDLLEEPLSAARSKARIKNLQNIEIVKADVEKIIPRLLANSLDLVLMTNLLFQIKDKTAVFSEAGRVLKLGGKILVIDWKQSAVVGPEEKVTLEDVKTIAAQTGFSLASEFDAGAFHFGLIFEKK
jgi:ubiquinone/menaquinone biosynthesis C-methylase UbiE